MNSEALVLILLKKISIQLDGMSWHNQQRNVLDGKYFGHVIGKRVHHNGFVAIHPKMLSKITIKLIYQAPRNEMFDADSHRHYFEIEMEHYAPGIPKKILEWCAGPNDSGYDIFMRIYLRLCKKNENVICTKEEETIKALGKIVRAM
ncbi:MAG: hypothetical protein ACD_8C00010G0002 [uncultured bacterium]|nr:MAG: hypothetical protein ACD_8C00010G0002 [uncultured bacterium]